MTITWERAYRKEPLVPENTRVTRMGSSWRESYSFDLQFGILPGVRSGTDRTAVVNR